MATHRNYSKFIAKNEGKDKKDSFYIVHFVIQGIINKMLRNITFSLILFLILPVFALAEDLAITCQNLAETENSCQTFSSAQCKALLEQCAAYYDEQSAKIAQDLSKTQNQKNTLQ